jgi:hypothetical protein
MRLDQIIISRKLATEEQVREALEYQKEYGGRLETHLFRMGYIDEAGLVAALSEQLGCPPIVLTGLDIPSEVVGMIPAETAWSWLALPFAYDPAIQTLRVACECSKHSGLREDLQAACPGMKIEFYLALGVVLQAALVKYYRTAPAVVEIVSPEFEPPTNAISVPIEYLVSQSAKCQILLFEAGEDGIPSLGPVLRHQGFIVKMVPSVDDLERAVHESKPDALLMVVPDGRDSVDSLLVQLSDRSISILDFPTYLVTSTVDDSEIGELLGLGFEEVIRVQNVLDLLMIKLRRLKDRLVNLRNQRLEILQTLGTHGSLQDMNVVDLLQAMGTTGKTASISVTAMGKQLTVFLDRGRIIHANCDDSTGPEAVYCAIGWSQGVWNVDPIRPEDLPSPNIFTSSEGLLLEGCRRLDEMSRTGNSSPSDFADALSTLDTLV